MMASGGQYERFSRLLLKAADHPSRLIPFMHRMEWKESRRRYLRSNSCGTRDNNNSVLVSKTVQCDPFIMNKL